MAEGRVLWFDRDRGDGIIEEREGGRIYFDAAKLVADGHPALGVGQKVRYEVSIGASGRQAVEVVPL